MNEITKGVMLIEMLRGQGLSTKFLQRKKLGIKRNAGREGTTSKVVDEKSEKHWVLQVKLEKSSPSWRE